MYADVEFKSVAAYLGQADFAVVRKSLGASVKAVGKLYLGSCHGVNYTSSSFWRQVAMVALNDSKSRGGTRLSRPTRDQDASRRGAENNPVSSQKNNSTI